jgi:hypothetical protein
MDGHPCSPRQVRAGVPTGIDDVACRVLFEHTGGGNPPVTTPAMLATALNRVIPAPAAPPPVPHSGYGTGPATLAPGPPYWQRSPAPPRRAGRDPVDGRGPGGSRALAVVAGMLVVAVIGVAAWAFSHHRSAPPPGAKQTHSASPSNTPATALPPKSAVAFGPNGGDNVSQAGLAIDSSPATAWTTDSYRGSPHFGNLYGATGLMLDMGKSVNVSSVTVTFGNIPGTHVRVEIGNTGTGTGRAPPPGFTTLDKSNNAAGPVTFTGHRTSGRFVLIWFTKLARQPGQSGYFQADVFNVAVRGSS